MTDQHKAVLLVRNAERVSEALHIGKALLDTGASVTLVCLCPAAKDRASRPLFPETMAVSVQAHGALPVLYCGEFSPLSAIDGFPDLSLKDLAGLLKTADTIIPF